MMMLSNVAEITRGRQQGEDVAFDSVSIDTRSLRAGALFVALEGPNFNGHDFLPQALQRGAAAALVSQPAEAMLPTVEVSDTRRALGEVAASWRRSFELPLVAVTGSNGKTTVKEMLAAIFSLAADNEQVAVLATEGNLNNDLGVPLTLLRLRKQHRYAVIEMGMSHAGELSYLTHIAQPDIAIVTNAAAAHLEGLGDVASVARAKGEIFEGLGAAGCAVLNADDAFLPLWQELTSTHKVITFALHNPADVSAEYELETDHSHGVMSTPWGSIPFTLAAPGRHNVVNALAAAAAAGAAGIPPEYITRGLAHWQGSKGRLQIHDVAGVHIIDDSYNANPASMRAAADVLASCPGERTFVMGDMGELGADAAAMHAAVCRYLREAGIESLFTLGRLSCDAATEFGADARCFGSHEELAADLCTHLKASSPQRSTVLVKGSRAMQMDRVVEALITSLGGG